MIVLSADSGAWVPFFSALIWPVFVVVVFAFFRGQVKAAFDAMVKAIQDGRGVRIGHWLEIRASETPIADLGQDGSVLSLATEDIGDRETVAVKGSPGLLGQLEEQARQMPSRRVETLVIRDGLHYSRELLQRYIASLRVRTVVFDRDDQFEGWIDAGVLAAGLDQEPQDHFSYGDLMGLCEALGLQHESVTGKSSALDTLRIMDEARLDMLPVVSDGKLLFMVSRGRILSRLLTESLLEKRNGSPSPERR